MPAGGSPTIADTQTAPPPTTMPTAAPRPESSPTITETRSALSPTPTHAKPEPSPSATPSWPNPTPTPGIVHYNFPCGPYFGTPQEFQEHFVEWTPDGQHIVFNRTSTSRDRTIWIVDAEGTRLRAIAYVSERISPLYGFHGSLSPDAPQIVYSSCEYETESLEDPRLGQGGREKFHYELAVVHIDGSSPRRLTENEYLDHYPVWSPDGTQIAFLADPEQTELWELRLFTMSPDGSNVSEVTTPEGVALYPPVWSSDGERLAFIATEYHRAERVVAHILYAVRTDGSELSRIGETTAVPTWSPDGKDLTFASGDGAEAAIYGARADGSGLRTLWTRGGKRTAPPISQVSWSPDGSEILFVSDDVYVVGADGGGLRRVARGHYSGPVVTAWSPDGARLAVHYTGSDHYQSVELLTMARDGSDVRILARSTGNGLLASNKPEDPGKKWPADPAACPAGVVVPEPAANPGLVGDCETLYGLRETLEGARGRLNWHAGIPITKWEGVRVGGSPARVVGLYLSNKELAGTVPPQLAELTQLQGLDLSRNPVVGGIPGDIGRLTELQLLQLANTYVAGHLPRELGRLTALQILDLSYSYLGGSIPSELGSLAALRDLLLGYSNLSGSIPPELGALVNLGSLDLAGNDLSGGIPPEMGALAALQDLDLSNNRLGGSIPPELGALTVLGGLLLDGNDLSGTIPPELGGLTVLRALAIEGNHFSGCIPAELPAIWDEELELKRCDTEGAAGS